MERTYFTQMTYETPTRVWVNNPTLEEIDLALAQGAVGCTTNPAYGGNLLRRAPELVRPVIAECIPLSGDDETVADLVQQRLVARVVERFRPVHEQTGGRWGFVSIQGAPDRDTDTDAIIEQAHTGHALGPNAAPKLPATAAGLAALEVLVAEGYPTIVTEVFSLAQLVDACDRYVAVTSRTGVRPPFFVSPISGIFGDHLKALAARDGIDVPKPEMELVGIALARDCQRFVEERSYPVTLLIGGARIPFDLTGIVGAPMCATINWATFAEILSAGTSLTAGIRKPIEPAVIARLEATFPDVRRALTLDGLSLEEYEDFGPVQHFRNSFVAGWSAVRATIAETRASLAGVAR